MHDIILTIAELVVMAATLAITRYLLPWISAKVGGENLKKVTYWVNNAVKFAAQTMDGKDGADKKATVLSFMEELCSAKGIKLTTDELNVLIEAAVKELNGDEFGVMIGTAAKETENNRQEN